MDTVTLEQLKNILVLHEIKPADHYIAAAGAYYGQVTSWDLGDAGFLVWHRGLEGEGFSIHEDDDDLADHLESTQLSPLDAMLRTANVRGVDEVPDADPAVNCAAAYVLKTLYFRGGNVGSPTAFAEWPISHAPRRFQWIWDAQKWIDLENDRLYLLSESEIHAPTYKIVTL